MITSDQLSSIAPNLKEPKLSLYTDKLNEAMEEFEINTPERMAHFLAQVMHESGEGRYVRELASGSAYEGRKDLGNTEPGDGVRFKGRGFIQITGRNNYKLLSDAFDVDFIGDPLLLESPEYVARSAAWFWSTHHLNQYADLDTEESFKTETRRINGGLNGLADRQKYLERARDELCQ